MVFLSCNFLDFICRIEDLKNEIKRLKVDLEEKDNMLEGLVKNVSKLNEEVVKTNEEKVVQKKVCGCFDSEAVIYKTYFA